jgi:hypothetical protein
VSGAWQSQYLFTWVFNVGRGVCTFARTPENFGLNVDCGGDGESRPLKRVEDLILPNLTEYGGRRVAQAVISHPHADNYRDIYRMVGWKPHFITCPNNKDRIEGYPDEHFNFDLLATTEEDEPLLRVYKECFSERNLPMQVPAFGEAVPNFHYGVFYIRPPVVEDELPRADYINNCSIMAYMRIGRSAILLPGDMMTSGMDHAIGIGCEARRSGSGVSEIAREKTIDMKAFSGWLRNFGCTFLVAPHHGLESAWPQALFDFLADAGHQVSLALVSEKGSPGKSDGKVDSRYSSEDYIKGCRVHHGDGSSETRRAITTRKDGHMLIAMHHTGKPTVVVSHDLDWILAKAPAMITSGSIRSVAALV